MLALYISGGELDGDIRIGECDKSFHAELHDNNLECYLITIFEAKASKDGNRKSQLDIKATVSNSIRGTKKIGDKIDFYRVSDGGFRKHAEYLGEMYYVFYRKVPMNGSPDQGKFYIDPQDPMAMFSYTKTRAKIVSHHPHKKISK